VGQKVNTVAQAAIECKAALDPSEAGAYRFEVREGMLEIGEVFRVLVENVQIGVSIPVIPARFHNGLGEVSCRVCAEIHAKRELARLLGGAGVGINGNGSNNW